MGVGAVVLLFTSIEAIAQPIQVFQCRAKNDKTGKEVSVLERRDVPTANWANAFFDADTGQPTILYSRKVSTMAPPVQAFIQMHECCHLSENLEDEIEANCCAIRRMKLSDRDLGEVEKVTKSVGWLPVGYGGSGEEFWRLTMEKCGK
jgi:hypothetical protein